jgi:hypothetical protein
MKSDCECVRELVSQIITDPHDEKRISGLIQLLTIFEELRPAEAHRELIGLAVASAFSFSVGYEKALDEHLKAA